MHHKSSYPDGMIQKRENEMKISVENIRGFEGVHVFPIRPITILIGENSSGKTTLLGAIYAALNRDFPSAENLFNRAPFEMGSFDTIATYRGGKYGRAGFFSLGWERGSGEATKSINATYKSYGGTPKLNSLIVRGMEGELRAHAIQDGFEFEFKWSGRNQSRRKNPSVKQAQKIIKFKTEIKSTAPFRLLDVYRYYLESLNSKTLGTKGEGRNFEEVIEALHELTFGVHRQRPHATALAPLRTRPRRTYDELNEEFKPEGDHIPLVLARLLNEKQKKSGKELDALMKYGVASGLFEKIDVKRLGKQPSDPFQVRVKMKGPDANLIDVGYGVSQSLPIVIDSIMAPDNEVLLVQQPEVHLHPKAQAALGTFFTELAATTSKQFIIETHSDYLVDRIRISVAEKKIPASKIQLLYLERKGLDIKVHELSLDDSGNITNAPASYRDFFLAEELKLMSRAM